MHMGRVKSTAIKNLARKILEEHGGEFGTDFEHNKQLVGKLQKIDSRKVRNVVAGYITKEMAREKEASS
jgi:small subunit ribosomal protein S17e